VAAIVCGGMSIRKKRLNINGEGGGPMKINMRRRYFLIHS